MDSPEIKQSVKEHYTRIAEQSRSQNASSCCGSGSCCSTDDALLAEDYAKLDGYVREADLGLGCGIPVDVAGIKEGHTVIDLGSGAGNDVFVARRLVGERGKVIGIDMTEAMIRKAVLNKEKLGYANVEFRLGEIEDLPVRAGIADVVVSNCVLNLVPDKAKAFAEIFRVLKPGGHFSISDVVLEGELPPAVATDAALYAGCIAGALQRSEYIATIWAAGFSDVEVKREKRVTIPERVLASLLDASELAALRASGAAVTSITVVATKPAASGCGCGTCS
jgi:SAM-dependent methyltransferase